MGAGTWTKLSVHLVGRQRVQVICGPCFVGCLLQEVSHDRLDCHAHGCLALDSEGRIDEDASDGLLLRHVESTKVGAVRGRLTIVYRLTDHQPPRYGNFQRVFSYQYIQIKGDDNLTGSYGK